MSPIQLLVVLIAVAHGLVTDGTNSPFRSPSASLGVAPSPSLRRDTSESTFRYQRKSKHIEASGVASPHIATVVHLKKANGEYKRGSPLYNKQEGIYEKLPVVHDKQANATRSVAVAVGENSGQVAVYGMGSMVVLLSLTFAMANSSNRMISNFTWHSLDNIISIFLAVLVFQAIDQVVYDEGLIPQSHFVLGSFIYANVLLLIVVVLSYILKGTPSNLAIFVASSAHFVAFGFMHSANLGFQQHSSHLWHAAILFAAVLAIIGCVYLLGYRLKEGLGLLEERNLMEKVDDLENDAGAMAASMAWTVLVCYVMTSEFQDILEEQAIAEAERRYMLYYAIAISVIGAVIICFISAWDCSTSYFKKRLGMFCSASLAMCIAWAWLLWGKWRFHESGAFDNAPMCNRIAFAFCASLVALAAIVILVKMPGDSEYVKKDKALALLTVSLVAGWAWEEAFDTGLEILAEGEGEHYKGYYKVICTLCMLAVVLPVHVMYFKPIVARLPKDGKKQLTGGSDVGSPPPPRALAC